MGFFYVDDSVHDEAGFIIGACVYTATDVEEKIVNIIASRGFDPLKFEYKSSSNYSKEPEQAKIRSDLRELIYKYGKLGAVVVPRNQRSQLGLECIMGLKQFIDHNKELQKPLHIFFDQGMFESINKAQKLVEKLCFNDCFFLFEQNSKIIRGIQLADLAAHTCSIQLKDKMGLVKKMVKVGPNSGYDPEMKVELGFEMWASLRYTFFNQGGRKYNPNDDLVRRATLDVEPNGLYISDLCNEELSKHAKFAFGKMYLGCIH
jgi:hypothetical protein